MLNAPPVSAPATRMEAHQHNGEHGTAICFAIHVTEVGLLGSTRVKQMSLTLDTLPRWQHIHSSRVEEPRAVAIET
eukprot:1235163-Pyramimonas_sp.AAC.1